jgi:Mycothiol maleylpyruvate isomerase N-terminal domain
MIEIITRIDDAIQRVVRAIALLAPSQMSEPRLAGGRSVKDLLAHLTWWDQWLLYTLPAEPNVAQPAIKPPLFDQIPNTNDWAEELNAQITAYNRAREVAPILAEFTATYPRLVQRVAQLSSQDLYDPEHYEDHAHELEQLLGK